MHAVSNVERARVSLTGAAACGLTDASLLLEEARTRHKVLRRTRGTEAGGNGEPQYLIARTDMLGLPPTATRLAISH